MSVLFGLLGVISFVASIYFMQSIRSDIQIIIVIQLMGFALVFGGISSILNRVRRKPGEGTNRLNFD